MGRCVPILIRAAVIAWACAMLLICVRAAHAQPSNDDRYGFVPVPAPTDPVQQAPLPPAYPAQQQQTQQTYAPPAPSFSQNFTPPQAQMPLRGYVQAPPQTQGYPQTSMQGYTPAPQQQPYGYVPAQQAAAPNQGGYYAQGASRYGTQMAADPGTYYAASSNGQTGIASGYLIGPGDKLRVSVFEEDDLSGEYQIDGSGMVRLPLIGTLRAAGLTAPTLENAIAGALAQGYLKNPRVNVEITAYRPFYIMGAVNRPGNYPYVNNMSTLDAVALGGGFTDQARQSVVYVRHEGSTVEEELPANQLTRIWPGDVVRVKDTLFWDAMQIFTPLAGPAALAAASLH
jgi:protein involved in polysaccharide export with SLBB domain